MSIEEDKRLIKDYLNGEAAANAVIDHWISQVIRNAKWDFHSDVEDLIQDVKLALLENFRDDKFAFRSAVKTYVWRVSKYTCIDYLRCRRQLLSIDNGNIEIRDRKNTPETELYKKEQEVIFKKILLSLPQHCQDLLQMVFEQKYHYSQIAEHLKISEGTVKSRVARCKEKVFELARQFSANRGWADSTISI